MGQLFANGARGTLSAGIASGDTSLTISSGGALFPIANTGTGAVGGSLDWFKAVLDDGTNFEIVYVRTHTSASTSFTNVQRGQEGTTALSFAAGATLGVRVTAEDMRLSIGREKLTADRTYYVRTPAAAVSFTNASANITWTAHGLSVDAAVVLSVLPNTGTFTVTIASPGVFSKTAHGYAAGRPVKFSTTGALPTGLTAGTTYYVIATGLTADAFQLSATVGGAAVNTSGSQSGTHYAETTGAMPTFSTAGLLVAGTVYYVKTVVDADNITLATTAGGTAIGTCTVATGSPVYSASTGSDSNTGLTNTVGGALLTAQKAISIVSGGLDLSTYQATIAIADSVYPDAMALKSYLGATPPIISGNTTIPENVLMSGTATMVTGTNVGTWVVKGTKLVSSAGGGISVAGSSTVQHHSMNFGQCAASHIAANYGALVQAMTNYKISGGSSAQAHMYAVGGGKVVCSTFTVTLIGVPAFVAAYAWADRGDGYFEAYGMTFVGTATGTRYLLGMLSSCFVNGAATTYFPGNALSTPTTGAQYG